MRENRAQMLGASTEANTDLPCFIAALANLSANSRVLRCGSCVHWCWQACRSCARRVLARASRTSSASALDSAHVRKAALVAMASADQKLAAPAQENKVRGAEDDESHKPTQLLRTGRNMVYDLVGRNEIPHRRLGKQIRFSRAAINAMVESVVIAGREGRAVTMPVRRDPRTGGWFFRTTIKTPDGKKLRIFGTAGVPGPMAWA